MPPVLETSAQLRRLAMDLLARREHSSAELRDKLLKRGADPDLIAPVLAQLAAEGLLSEARYLEVLIRKRAQAGYGPLRIREELAQQGLKGSEVTTALQAFDWAERLNAVWQRKFAGQRPETLSERARQTRFLVYRGFPADLIRRLWS